MGGGDLNLKKSWHPTTLRNMERVWKAEQKHEAECKKIEELQKELQDERDREDIRHYAEEKGVVKKKADRLDWMYEGPASHINREEYLLGRTVDKTFELFQQAETAAVGGDFKTEGDTIPESILKKPSKGGNVTIDLANKIREDPLLVIRKQEEQNKKELLENPVRMKQLREMLQQMKGKNSDKKKKRKKNKRQKRSSSSDEYSSDEETKRGKRKRRDSSSGKMRMPHREMKDRYRSSPDSHRQPKHHRHRRQSTSPPSSQRSMKHFNGRQEQSQHGYTMHKGGVRAKDRLTKPKTRSSAERFQEARKPKKLDAAERERRLKEMISNAQWRDEQRDSNMKRHMSEVKNEEEILKKTGKVDIMTPMLSRAANASTVESRIKSNIYNIQRTKADLEKSFTKR